MTSEYCAVGPTFVLLGEGDPLSSEELVLHAEEHRGEIAARLSAAMHLAHAVRIREPHSTRLLSGAENTELLRLFARVCADFWGYRFPLEIQFRECPGVTMRNALSADGFSTKEGHVWHRPPGPFTRTAPKARGMEDVYGDLYSVPWNFVPRERDVYEPLIAEAPRSSLTVLDLGCGVGKNVGPLAARGFSMFGIDVAFSAVKRCRDLVDQPERFIVATAAHLPWRANCFDRVLDVGSLHCMPSDERRLAVFQIARVLAPGGVLYSRFFKPRSATWIRMQPMEVVQFGLTVDEVLALLNGPLVCESVTEHSAVIYAKARKPASS